jgi:hypothetical protein
MWTAESLFPLYEVAKRLQGYVEELGELQQSAANAIPSGFVGRMDASSGEFIDAQKAYVEKLLRE